MKTSFVLTLFLFATTNLVMAQNEKSDQAKPAEDRQALFAKVENLLKKSSMIGTFTIDGDKEGRRIDERYDISRVEKQAEGDYWVFYSRIKYGNHDVTLPIPVQVKWAGNTPVITVDNLAIPGLGVFDSRVVISDNKYAGTWRHGKVGGLMFGHIKKQKDLSKEQKEDKSATEKAETGDSSAP